jgi:S-methylmethionine-dependent homocysteine/selenocysteine methylase
MQLRSIDFLRDVATPYKRQLPALMYVGVVGPRGDAYTADDAITADEAQEYHSTQIATLALAGVNLVEAMTFNNVPEAVGVARAAAVSGLPASISFALDSTSRLSSGPSLKEAIETVDALASAR